MSCGAHLNDRRKPVDPATAVAAFGLPPTTAPADVFASWWADEADATESARLNRDEHGHGAAVRGPVPWDGGWITMVDLGIAVQQHQAATAAAKATAGD